MEKEQASVQIIFNLFIYMNAVFLLLIDPFSF